MTSDDILQVEDEIKETEEPEVSLEETPAPRAEETADGVESAEEEKKDLSQKEAGSSEVSSDESKEAGEEPEEEENTQTADFSVTEPEETAPVPENSEEEKKDLPRRSGKNLIHMEKIVRTFYEGTENELEVLHGIDLDVQEGEFAAIVGASGSGKSTLMNIIGLLDHPTSGKYLLEGMDVYSLSEDELSDLRGSEIGFVFQTYNLIPRTSALKNVEMPMMYARVPQKERTERAMELLELVGMEDRMDHNPDELSGGQKQRVAIARAMANDPALILADEPTGALDSKTGHQVMDLFHRLHEKEGKTILLITHAQELAEETERIITLKDGSIQGEREGERCWVRISNLPS